MISKFQTKHDRVNETLKTIRASLGMTQGQMAEALGFSSTATIAHYENGRRALPIDILYQAADMAGHTGWCLCTCHPSH
jgi:transcriptional regulator with XRE-family HTH domain